MVSVHPEAIHLVAFACKIFFNITKYEIHQEYMGVFEMYMRPNILCSACIDYLKYLDALLNSIPV